MEQPQTFITDNANVEEQLKKALELFNDNKFTESSDLFSKILEIKYVFNHISIIYIDMLINSIY